MMKQTLVGTSSHVHSSPLPFPPVHYDRLTGHGAAGVNAISGGGGSSGSIGAGGNRAGEPATGPASSGASAGASAATAAAAAAAAAANVAQATAQTKLVESIRKRQYRVGLNLFNKKPERGIQYLTQKVTVATGVATLMGFWERVGFRNRNNGHGITQLLKPVGLDGWGSATGWVWEKRVAETGREKVIGLVGFCNGTAASGRQSKWSCPEDGLLKPIYG